MEGGDLMKLPSPVFDCNRKLASYLFVDVPTSVHNYISSYMD